MKNVYVVVMSTRYEGDELLGVFSNKQKAEQSAKRHSERSGVEYSSRISHNCYEDRWGNQFHFCKMEVM